MNLKELEQAFENNQYLNSGGDKAKILEITTWWEEDKQKKFELSFSIQTKMGPWKFSTREASFIEALTLWEEPSTFTLKDLEHYASTGEVFLFCDKPCTVTKNQPACVSDIREGIVHDFVLNWKGIECLYPLSSAYASSVLHLFQHVKSAQKEEPNTSFHQECIDLLKDYKLNKEALEVQEALNVIRCSIKSAIGNIGSTKHSFEMVTSPFSPPIRLKALTMLAKELPNKYNGMTDIWTFYTSPDTQM